MQDSTIRSHIAHNQKKQGIRARMVEIQKEYSTLSMELKTLSSNTLHLREQYLIELKELQLEIDEKKSF